MTTSITISANTARGAEKLASILMAAAQDPDIFLGSPAKDKVREDDDTVVLEDVVEKPKAKAGPGRPKKNPDPEPAEEEQTDDAATEDESAEEVDYDAIKKKLGELSKLPKGIDKGKALLVKNGADTLSALSEKKYSKIYDELVEAIKSLKKK